MMQLSWGLSWLRVQWCADTLCQGQRGKIYSEIHCASSFSDGTPSVSLDVWGIFIFHQLWGRLRDAYRCGHLVQQHGFWVGWASHRFDTLREVHFFFECFGCHNHASCFLHSAQETRTYCRYHCPEREFCNWSPGRECNWSSGDRFQFRYHNPDPSNVTHFRNWNQMWSELWCLESPKKGRFEKTNVTDLASYDVMWHDHKLKQNKLKQNKLKQNKLKHNKKLKVKAKAK